MEAWTVAPCHIQWSGLNKTLVKTGLFGRNRRERKLLTDLTGEAKAGQMLAIMGPTGCGKTTLLNILAGRVKPDNVNSVTYNGHTLDGAVSTNLAYVLQDDIFYPDLTVKETLDYTTSLRLGPGHKDRRDQIIKEFSLDKCKDTIIGDYLFRGISGGERKRVNIANEVLAYPSVLLLDEPTSGLDSATAHKVMTNIKDLTNHGITVIVSIHQPSEQIYSLFDDLLLMSAGRTVYYGPANELDRYLDDLGYINPELNVPDHALRLLVDNEAVTGLIADYKQVQIERTIGEKMVQAKAPSWLWKTWTLTKRASWRQRSRLWDKVAIIQMILVAIISGLIWLQIDDKHVDDRYGALFFIGLQAGCFYPLLSTIYSLPSNLRMLTKERGSKLYSISSFFISINVSNLPFQLLYPSAFIVITYWMMGLNSGAAHFFACMAIILSANFSFSGYAYLTSTIITDTTLAVVISTSTTVIWMIVSGFFLDIKHIPVYVRWLQWISPIKYMFEALVYNEFGVGHAYSYFYMLVMIGFGLVFRFGSYLYLQMNY